MKYFLLLTLSLILAACSSSDPYSDYMGFWQQDDTTSSPKIAEIKVDGDTYLIEQNVLKDTNILGKQTKPMVITATDGKLSINGGLGSFDLGLSDDKKTLYLANNTYSKIDENTLNTIKQEQVQCRELEDAYSKEIKEVKLFTDGYEAKRDLIQNNYLTKFESVPNCKTPFNI